MSELTDKIKTWIAADGGSSIMTYILTEVEKLEKIIYPPNSNSNEFTEEEISAVLKDLKAWDESGKGDWLCDANLAACQILVALDVRDHAYIQGIDEGRTKGRVEALQHAIEISERCDGFIDFRRMVRLAIGKILEGE